MDSSADSNPAGPEVERSTTLTLTPTLTLTLISDPNPNPIEAHLTTKVPVQHFGDLRYKRFYPIRPLQTVRTKPVCIF